MFFNKKNINNNSDKGDVKNSSTQINAALKIFSLVIIAFVGVSAYANFETWTVGKTGVEYAIFGTVGIGSEILGAIMLLFVLRLLASKSFLFTMAALPVLALWGLCASVNANASWEYFVTKDGAEERAQTAQLENTQNLKSENARQTKLDLKNDRILEIQKELDLLPATRTPASIKAELDNQPENYVTKRGQLKSELEEAKYRTDLVDEITQLREEVVDLLDASVNAAPVQQEPVKEASLVSGFLANKWLIVVGIMEFCKAFGFAIILLVSENEKRRVAKLVDKAPRKSRSKTRQVSPSRREQGLQITAATQPPKLSVVPTQSAPTTNVSDTEQEGIAVFSLDGRIHKARTL